MIHEEQGYPL